MKKILFILALAALTGLLYAPLAHAVQAMTPWQLFQHLCGYVSPGSLQCIQQQQQAITPLPPSSGQQQQATTPYCTTNPNDPACQQQLQQQQQQVGPPPDGP